MEKTRKRLLQIVPFIIAATIILGSTAVFMGVVYNYTNSKSIVIEIGLTLVTVIGLLALPWPFIKSNLKSLIVWMLGLFAAVSIIATVFGVDPTLSWYSHLERGVGLFFVLVTLIGCFFAVMVTRYTNTFRKAILYSIAAATGIVALSTIIGYTGFNISSSIVLQSPSAGGGFTGNSSFAGTLFMMGFFMILYLFATSKNSWSKAALFVAGIVTLVNPVIFGHGIFHNGFHHLADFVGDAHGATVSLVLGLLITLGIYLSYSSKKIKALTGRIVIALVLAATLAALVLLVLPGNNPVNRVFVKETGEARFIYWNMSVQSIKDHPLFGTGPETFRYAHQAYFDPRLVDIGELWADKPHNAYLEILVTTGIVGFLSYLGIIFATIWELRKLGKSPAHRLFVAVLGGLLFAYLLNDFILFDIAISYLLFFLVLFWISSEKKATEDVSRFGFSKLAVALQGLLAILVLWAVFGTVLPEIKKLHLDWNELFSPVSTRMTLYQEAEDASPYGAGISFAQQADTYGQTYLEPLQISKDEALADISSISKTLLSSMVKYPVNMQGLIALEQLAHARIVIEGKVDPNALKEMYVASQGVIDLSPTNPRGYLMLADAYGYDDKKAEQLSALQKAYALDPNASTLQLISEITQKGAK